MDGLREDAEVLFILTTIRSEQIEPVLVSRPGPIDQAIEFPLPDEEGRGKLTTLYARGLEISEDLMKQDRQPTSVRHLSRSSCGDVRNFRSNSRVAISRHSRPWIRAKEEVLFAGGALNRRLLGARALTRSQAELLDARLVSLSRHNFQQQTNVRTNDK